jgi:subtilase family serine protease
MSQDRRRIVSAVLFASLAVLLIAAPGFAQSAGRVPSNAQILGAEDQSKQISVTLWLTQHDKANFDETVRQMYDRSSPNYHHFLTIKEYEAKFAPRTADMATVRQHLEANNLHVVAADKMNHYVTAQGRVSDIQRAIGTQVNLVKLRGQVHRVPASDIAVPGAAGKVVAGVQVSDLAYTAYAAPSRDLDTGLPFQGVKLVSGGNPDGLFYTANCFRSPEVVTFKTDGGFPKAIYKGNRYGANIGNAPPNQAPCGYDAAELQKAYGLNAAFKKGLNGNGQTIVIVDGFGSNTIVADANEFSSLNGLPALTPSNFQIYYPNGPATCTASNGCIGGNWQYETTLDVESAHAIAPGANIALLETVDNSFTSLDIGNLYAIENELGTVISNSFGISEIALVVFEPSELVVENNLSETAAALGISQQISTGDDGDNLVLDQEAYGIDSVSPNADASSPYVTAVGGTSLFLKSDNNIKFQTGWGLNVTRIADATPNPPTVPPLQIGFEEGAGGGVSTFFAKPAFQAGLPGDFRLLPDVSMLADPQTGFELIVTPDSVPGDPQYVEVFGGTSLSSPMFTAVWAIANQAAGVPLGQAASYLYSLTGSAIYDVVPLTSATNPTGVIYDPPAAQIIESANTLASPLENTTEYISAIYNSPSSTRWDVLTFGTDSSLTTAPGWDNVTGVGTPNALPLIEQVLGLVTP